MAPLGQHLALRAPFSLARRAQGSAPGPPLSRHPASVKRVNRVEERKLLPESETLWDNIRLYPWAPGRNSHSLARDVREHQRGEGRGGYRSIEAPQINEPSINTPPPSTLALSSPFSLPTLCFLSLALSHTPGAPLPSTGGVASERRGRQRL